MADQGKGRIAIKFGGNPTSSKPSRTNPPSSLGKRPRSQAWGGGGSDSEPDDDDRNGRHEAITGFGAHGAETANKKRDLNKEKKQFVIERQPNRDWRSDAKAQRKGKNLLPAEARAQQNGTTVEIEPADQDKSIQWGLTVKKRRTEDDTNDEAPQAATQEAEASTPGDPDSERKAPAPRTADDEAMDSLLGKAPEKPLAVIQSEDDAYRRDVETAGAASTLEDYEAMPVEEFGAALLRGMGWDGSSRGSKPKEVRRRPNRLGLGAKELKEDEDLGGWNQKGKKPRPPRLNDYRREEDKRKESRRRDDSYKSERDMERDRPRDGHRDRYREPDRDYDRRRDRHGDHRRDRR